MWKQTIDQEKSYDVVINDKFVFIQIPKTGTSSIVSELKRIGLTQNIKCYRHEGLKYIKHLCKNNIPIYAIVRNPYRQTLSYFFHRINYGEITVDKNNIVEEFRKWCKDSKIGDNIHLLQSKYLDDQNKKIQERIVAFKFEDGVDFFIQFLNKTHNLSLNPNSHTNQNKVSEYKNIQFLDFFDDETVDIIKTQLKLQFEAFKYSTNIHEA